MSKPKKIAFIANEIAIWPDIEAYCLFFENLGFETKVFRYTPNELELSPFSIEWHFMGKDFSPKNENRLKINEYCSQSMPPYVGMKNFLKRVLFQKADIRVFQNETIAQAFGFKGKVFYRDMGISESFFNFQVTNENKKFDFIYPGTVTSSRPIKQLIKVFQENFEHKNLLILGIISDEFKKLASQNIILNGPVPNHEVPIWLSQTEYGINLADQYPLDNQTSTKILEFSAMNLKILSTESRWVDDFEKKTNASIFRLKSDFSNLNQTELEKFSFKNGEVSDYKWDNIFATEHFKALVREIEQYCI